MKHKMVTVIFMFVDVCVGILLPLLGTALGSSCSYFMRKGFDLSVQRILSGFAGGVMVAASVWSLIIPAIESSSYMGVWSFVPALVGFWLGISFLMITERMAEKMRTDGIAAGAGENKGTFVMILAVALHNFPEGMAVGVVYADLLSGSGTVSVAEALVLSIGIAVQNFPEGAVVSMPLRAAGFGQTKAFIYGLLSGIVEPIGAVLTVAFSGLFLPALPYFLGFAAGAMIYVVVEELVSKQANEIFGDIGTVFFAIGFSLMMSLDVALG